jgi:hypothetical protein
MHTQWCGLLAGGRGGGSERKPDNMPASGASAVSGWLGLRRATRYRTALCRKFKMMGGNPIGWTDRALRGRGGLPPIVPVLRRSLLSIHPDRVPGRVEL